MAPDLQILSLATQLHVADLSVPCTFLQNRDNDSFYLKESLGRLNELVRTTYLKGCQEVNSQPWLAISITCITVIAKSL